MYNQQQNQPIIVCVTRYVHVHVHVRCKHWPQVSFGVTCSWHSHNSKIIYLLNNVELLKLPAWVGNVTGSENLGEGLYELQGCIRKNIRQQVTSVTSDALLPKIQCKYTKYKEQCQHLRIYFWQLTIWEEGIQSSLSLLKLWKCHLLCWFRTGTQGMRQTC